MFRFYERFNNRIYVCSTFAFDDPVYYHPVPLYEFPYEMILLV